MNDLLKKLLEGVVQPEPVSSKIEYPSPLLEPKRVPVDFSNETDTVKAAIAKPSAKMPTPPFESKNAELPSFTQETNVEQTSPDIFANVLRTPSVDEELKKTQADSLEATRNLMALQGAHQIGAALAQQKANDQYVKPYQDIEAKKVSDLLNRRKEERDQDDQYMQRRDQAMQEAKFNLDFGDETKRRDPNSNESKEAVKILNQMFEANGLPTRFNEGEMSFARIKELNPLFGDIIQAKARKDAAALSREDMRTRRDEAREDKLKKESTLSDKQVTDITAIDNSLDTLATIKGLKSKMDTGKMSAAQNTLAQAIGVDDPNKSAFKSLVQDQLAQYIKSISGAAVSDTERKFLLENLPNVSDNDKTFNAKLEAVQNRLSQSRKRTLENLSKKGKNVSDFSRQELNTTSSSKPKTVQQNGHTYTLNEETGEYE